MNSNGKKWLSVLESGMKSSRMRKSEGPSFNASATEVDVVGYLSEYWDSKGFVREQILR
jgi:hypothetical protein